VNVWEERDEDNIVYDTKTNAFKGATLNKLVERLTVEKDHDMEFQKTFLLTFQSFTTPEKLIMKLIQRYQVPIEEKPEDSKDTKEQWAVKQKAKQKNIQLRVVNVMKRWVESNIADLNDQHIETIKNFQNKYLKYDSESLYHLLEGALQKRVQMIDEVKKPKVFNEQPPEPKVDLKTIFLPNLSFIDLDEAEIARQLTLIEFDFFSVIQPSELLNQAWNKPKLRHRASNVLSMINRTNEVSGWVSTMILQEERLRQRAKMWTKFIKIAEQLRN